MSRSLDISKHRVAPHATSYFVAKVRHFSPISHTSCTIASTHLHNEQIHAKKRPKCIKSADLHADSCSNLQLPKGRLHLSSVSAFSARWGRLGLSVHIMICTVEVCGSTHYSGHENSSPASCSPCLC